MGGERTEVRGLGGVLCFWHFWGLHTICHFENDVETMDVLFCFMFQFYIFLEGQQFWAMTRHTASHFGSPWLVTKSLWQAWEPTGLHTRLFREDEVLRGVPWFWNNHFGSTFPSFKWQICHRNNPFIRWSPGEEVERMRSWSAWKGPTKTVFLKIGWVKKKWKKHIFSLLSIWGASCRKWTFICCRSWRDAGIWCDRLVWTRWCGFAAYSVRHGATSWYNRWKNGFESYVTWAVITCLLVVILKMTVIR